MDADAERPVRQCRISLSALAQGIDGVSNDIAGFLDLEEAEVIWITPETFRELERVYEAMPAFTADATAEEYRAALMAAIDEVGLYASDKDAVLDADAIDRDRDTRYVPLPDADSHADYDMMADFAETVTDSRLQSRLERALGGRGPFRRFRDELRYDEAEQERWYAFKQQRMEERARDWLADEGIELVTE